MSFLSPPKVKPLPPLAPPPQVDDAQARINEQERAARRQGRKSTILTGDNGLPDLGSTTKVGS